MTEDLVFRSRGDKAYRWLLGAFGFYRHGTMNAPVHFKQTGIEELILKYANENDQSYRYSWGLKDGTGGDELFLGSDFRMPSAGGALYHESNYTLGRWRFTAGLRFDFEHARLRYRNYTDTWYTKTHIKNETAYERPIDIDDRSTLKQTFTELLPKFSVMYSFDETRNLYLTMQLMELDTPMVLALNMMDEVRANGGAVDVQRMSRELGIPVVPISAAKGEGVSELVDQALAAARGRVLPKVTDFCADDSAVHRCIHAVVHLIADHADRIGVPARFCAAKLIEGGDDLADRLALDQNERELLEHCIVQMETETGLDRNAALADMRYSFIENVVSASVVKCRESREHARSVKMDRLLTGRYTAVPVFLGIMLLTFWLTFDVIGQRLSDWLAVGVDALTALVDRGLTAYGINPVVKSLIVDGICSGVGSVLVFLPIIVTLFFFLSILEDTGYMARVAFVMDKPLRKIGLSGRSIVPMLIGFGCSVPAIMATRTVSSDRDRKMTILLTPYMSCSAKISIYAFFTAAFFPRYRALVMIGLYVLGILIGIAAALIMNKTAFRGKPVPFVMELPNYRLPSVKSVALLLWEKAKDFLQRAFTVIFLATIVIWFLQSFDTRLNVVSDSVDSLLALIGQVLAPIFAPLGFGDWRCATSLISGFIAKESVVSTLEVLLGGSAISGLFTTRSALSFLVFTLLYTPCVAAVATIRRELDSSLKTLGVVAMQCGVAWLASLAMYAIAGLF